MKSHQNVGVGCAQSSAKSWKIGISRAPRSGKTTDMDLPAARDEPLPQLQQYLLQRLGIGQSLFSLQCRLPPRRAVWSPWRPGSPVLSFRKILCGSAPRLCILWTILPLRLQHFPPGSRRRGVNGRLRLAGARSLKPCLACEAPHILYVFHVEITPKLAFWVAFLQGKHHCL